MLNACPTTTDVDVYQPRNPKVSAYYRCVEDHFEQLESVWDDRYQRCFGFWRPYVMDVIQRYMDCGDLHFGFARVKKSSSTWTYGMLNTDRLREPMVRPPNPSSHMMSPHRPARMITSSMLIIRLTCRGVVRRTKTEAYF
jgi:hypothetical protein